MSPPSALDDPYRLLRDLRALLDLHREFGIEGYHRSQELGHFLEPPPIAGLKTRPLPPRGDERNPASQDLEPRQTAIRTLTEIKEALGERCRCAVQAPSASSPVGTRPIFGFGNPKARLFIVGDLPAPENEAEGTPFSGEAGELLNRMLKAIGLDRDEVYLTTVVKCRPPDQDLPVHIKACLPLLIAQVAAVAPTVICAMGQLTAQALLHTATPLVRLRGHFHEWQHIPLMPTFHPDSLLKNPELKKAAWIDLQLIQAKLAS